MLRFGNKEFRNLQEQVLKNMQNIQDIMDGTTVLAEFGIKVIGQVDDAEDLPDPAEYEGDYGDAYIVGTEEPYEYYIFTRAFEGDETPQWFDLGIFPVPGPQGETGPQGPVGPQGPEGNPGSAGAAAGFGTISASAQTLVPGSTATATVVASGPDTAKSFAFTFGIPQGESGSSDIEWGDIEGTLSNQTDLQDALDGKVNTTGNESISGVKTFTDSAKFGNVYVSGDGNTLKLYASGMTSFKVGSPAMHFGSTTIHDDGSIVCTADDYGVDAYLQLPNKGTSVSPETIAVVSDIPSLTNYVTLDGTQSITGYKTFNRANTDDPIVSFTGG